MGERAGPGARLEPEAAQVGAAAAPRPSDPDFVARALQLAHAGKRDLISVAGPDRLPAMLTLCRAGFEEAECVWRATSVLADRPRDLLLLVGPMDPETLGLTVRRTARLLREGGLLVAELAAPQDKAVIAAALESQGRCVWANEAAGSLVAARVMRQRPRVAPAG